MRPEVVPLNGADALAMFRGATDCSSRFRYGLNEAAFAQIERLGVEAAGAAGEAMAGRAARQRRASERFLNDNFVDLVCQERRACGLLRRGIGMPTRHRKNLAAKAVGLVLALLAVGSFFNRRAGKTRPGRGRRTAPARPTLLFPPSAL